MKTIFTLIMALLVTVSFASAWGVTYPQPQELQLLRGEAARFWVTIDAAQSNYNLSCDLVGFGNQDLITEFDVGNQLMVPKGKVKALYGTVTAGATAPYGMQSLNFCPNCKEVKPSEEGTGVMGKYCVPYDIYIVSRKTKENPQDQIPPKHVANYLYYYIAGAAVVLLVLIIYLIIMLRKRKSKKSLKLKKIFKTKNKVKPFKKVKK
jgi:hypothetical protein